MEVLRHRIDLCKIRIAGAKPEQLSFLLEKLLELYREKSILAAELGKEELEKKFDEL